MFLRISFNAQIVISGSRRSRARFILTENCIPCATFFGCKPITFANKRIAGIPGDRICHPKCPEVNYICKYMEIKQANNRCKYMEKRQLGYQKLSPKGPRSQSQSQLNSGVGAGPGYLRVSTFVNVWKGIISGVRSDAKKTYEIVSKPRRRQVETIGAASRDAAL